MNPRLRAGGLSPLLLLYLAGGCLAFSDNGDPGGSGGDGGGGESGAKTFTQEQVDNIVRTRVRGLQTKLDASEGKVTTLQAEADKVQAAQTALQALTDRHGEDIELARAGLSNDEMTAARELHGKFGGDLSLLDFAKSKRSAIAQLAGVDIEAGGEPAGDGSQEPGESKGGDGGSQEGDEVDDPNQVNGPGNDPDGNRGKAPKPKLIDTDPAAWRKKMNSLTPEQLAAELDAQGLLPKRSLSLEGRLKGTPGST